MSKKGFTLLEIMIVVLILTTIAVIAIPGLLRARIASNETSAVASLRTIAMSQHQFKNSVIIDQDTEGDGEFGSLGELSSGAIPRGRAQILEPSFIPAGLTPRENSPFAQKSGYLFQIFLPSSNATGLTDNGANTLAIESDVAVINIQEQKFRVYAWPTEFAISGNKAYVANESGAVLASSNINSSQEVIFSGTSDTPAFDSAVAASSGSSGNAADFDGAIIEKEESLSTLVWNDVE